MGLLANHSEVIRRLQDQYNLKFAVETGTYLGEGTKWLSKCFQHVFTIEINEGFQNQAKQNLIGCDNITYMLGDSRQTLLKVMTCLNRPSFFWLDAHNAIQVYGSGPDDCPILEELDMILSSPFKHCIMIDDINAYYPPEQKKHHPVRPLDANVWPNISMIVEKLDKSYEYYTDLDADIMVVAQKI